MNISLKDNLDAYQNDQYASSSIERWEG